jgi:hypothetical protein
VSKNIVWSAESTRIIPYVEGHRAKNELVNTDSTLHEVFDICYDYDVYGAWRATTANTIPMKAHLEMVRVEIAIYRSDFIKYIFVKTHDQQRISYIYRNNQFKVLT